MRVSLSLGASIFSGFWTRLLRRLLQVFLEVGQNVNREIVSDRLLLINDG